MSPEGVLTVGAFFRLQYLLPALLLTASTSAHAEFYLTRNQGPFSLFQGQPLPLPADLSTGWSSELSLDITNTLNVQTAATQNLYADYESYHFNSRFARMLNRDWSFIIDVPLIRRSGGHLDNAIDSWHEVFGLPRASRPLVADNQFLISYIINGNNQLQLTEASNEIGDISIHFGYDLLRDNTSAVKIWGGIELPSGDHSSLAGNDEIDTHLTLSATDSRFEDFEFDFNLGLVLPGGDRFAGNPTADSVLFSYLAGTWQALDWLQLRLQFESHQSYFRDPTLDMLDKANVIVFGGSIVIDRCNRIDIGVSEDIDVGSSPDVSFLFNWSRRDCGQA